MDISYYNRNYRKQQYEYNSSNQYNIYGQYSDNINISSIDDNYDNIKKEKRSSFSNIFSFPVRDNKSKSNVCIIFIRNMHILRNKL